MKKLLITTLLFVLLLPGMAFAKEWPSQTNVPVDKVWTIMFNQEIDPASINNYSAYVTNNLGQNEWCKTNLNTSNQSISLKKPYGYNNYTNYFLHVSSTIKNINGAQLKEPIDFKFTTAPAKDAQYFTGTVGIKKLATVSGDIKGYINVSLENGQETEFYVSCFTTVDGNYDNQLFDNLFPGQIIHFSTNKSEPKHIRTIFKS